MLPSTMLRWLIVGGGLHGVHLAARLRAAGVPGDELAVVDPHAELLANWTECTRRTGMTHLRSPSVHHLDLDPWSLRRFAEGWQAENPSVEAFHPPYARPALSLFHAHSRSVVEGFDLDARHVEARVTRLDVQTDGTLRAQTTGGASLLARRVVLALGTDGAQSWPAWAQHARGMLPTRIGHVFDPAFTLECREDVRAVAVVGGGISAAQLAIKLAARGAKVALVCRHRLRRHQFDSDPMWLGPAKMNGFRRLKTPEQRRAAIKAARHRGSLPPDVHRQLRGAIASGSVALVRSGVRGCTTVADGFVLGLETGSLAVDAIALATGFAGIPGAHLLETLGPAFPRASCGTPLPDRELHWHANIYCAGALAELELGPVARNIAGARRAGERIEPVALRD